MMKIISTNIGEPKEINYKGKLVKTGIFKYPTLKPIFLDIESVKEDAICDRKYHGGIDQAVYGYSKRHYKHFKELFPNSEWDLGMFGENLTFDDLDETKIHVGDQFSLGNAILEATTSRQPCMKLGIRFNNMKIVKAFWKTTFCGVYFKILKTGTVEVGDILQPIKLEPKNKTIAQVFEENK